MKRIENVFSCFTACVLLCLSLGGCTADRTLVLSTDPREEDATNIVQEPEPSESSGEKSGNIYVHVCGAVREPQVIVLPAGSRGYEAVEAAGGFAEDASQDAVNLAEKLEDGCRLYIPTTEEAEAGREAELEAAREAESGLVNINKADASKLVTLPGIGEARAEAIIAYRESNGAFEDPEDIMRVPGIKESAYAKIKDKITVK